MTRVLMWYVVWCACAVLATPYSYAAPTSGMVATVNPLATDAGVDALQNGGNAVDAAIAAALTLGVVDSHNSGIGGGCFILVRQADGKLLAIDGREMAPAKATRNMYLRDGKPQTELSKTGALASGVPGALAAYDLVLKKSGRKGLGELILPAATIAEKGFPIGHHYAQRLSVTATNLKRFPASRTIFFKSNGSAYREGEVLKQPDLANSYRAIAKQGTSWFYRGPFAQKTQAWMKTNGGIITANDLANYRPLLREPIKSTYRGHTIVGFPPPSSGGIHVAQILNILETFDLAKLYSDDCATFTHVVAEAMKLAFADRAHWLGDADFAKVPRGLINKQYATSLAKQIDQQKATTVLQHGKPPHSTDRFFNRHTTHIAAADDEGNWIAITTTLNTSFGSKVVIPSTGILLNNQMDDFSIAPGVPNAFGLVGAEANSIEPGKRPLSSMSPTIVLKNGKPLMTLGAAGGPRIISQVVQAVINHLDLNMPLADALGNKRIHHQWSPDLLFVERGLTGELLEKLEQKGHTIKPLTYMGFTQAIARSKDGKLVGNHDPRVAGKAAGVK